MSFSMIGFQPFHLPSPASQISIRTPGPNCLVTLPTSSIRSMTTTRRYILSIPIQPPILLSLQEVDSVASSMDKLHPSTTLPVPPPPATQFPTTSTPLDQSPAPRPISSTRETRSDTVADISPTPVSYVDSIARPPHLPMTPQLPCLDLETPHAPTPSPPQPPLPPPIPMSSTREPSSLIGMSSTREHPSIPSPIRPPTMMIPTAAQRPAIAHSTRRSTCQRNAPTRLGYYGKKGAGYFVDPSAWIFQECGFRGPPLAFKASLSDPDTLSYDEAMADEPNLSKWMAAATKEIASLGKNKTWIERKFQTRNLDSFLAPKFSNVNGHPTVSSASTKHGTVYEEISRKVNLKPLHPWSLGVWYGYLQSLL